MTLRTRIMILNVSILTGLVLEYFRNAPLIVIVVSGVAILLLVNTIFVIVWRRVNKGGIVLGKPEKKAGTAEKVS